MAVGRSPWFLAMCTVPRMLEYPSDMTANSPPRAPQSAAVPFLWWSLISQTVISALFYLVISRVTLKGMGKKDVCVHEREREHCLVSILLLLFGPTSAI